MGVRALEARVNCTSEVLRHLWRTHVVFNDRLLPLISMLFRMRRGECGDNDGERRLYQKLATFILARTAKDAPYLLNAISKPNWVPNTAKKMKATVPGPGGQDVEIGGDDWADAAAALSAGGKLLYEKTALLGDVPETIRQMVARECAAIISSHEELVKVWEREHEKWLKLKAEWESKLEHRRYLELRPRFEEFEVEAAGKTGNRRGRWHKYLDWLRQHPELAAWRGGQATVVELSDAAKERICKARPRQARSIGAEEFWKANPELHALHKLHGYYEKTFVRRRKTKKHRDGFDHRPTFTLPEPVRHPRWFVFNAPQTSPQGYRRLGLPKGKDTGGTVDLQLLTGEKFGGKYPFDWTTVKFAADPRLADFAPITKKRPIRKGKTKGQEKDSDAFVFLDRQIQLKRAAQISGIKLLFRNVRLKEDHSLLSADPYLVFTCNIEDVPRTEAAKALKWEDTGEKRKRIIIPPGLVSCAVDLGIRHVGFATLAVKDGERAVRVLRSRNIWLGREEKSGSHPGRWSPGPELAHIAAHKRSLRDLRRLRGKPVKDEQSHIKLQDHITNIADDRFKKAAREIVNFALNVEGKADRRTGEIYPRADVLIVENLANLLPDSERERGINAALIEFNRGHLVDRIREVAKDCGLKLILVSPVGTSQVCSRCGALGRRYSIKRDRDAGCSDIHFGLVEALFACPCCGYMANSDHNAAVNLQRRFFFGDSAIQHYDEWRARPDKERAAVLRGIEGGLLDSLRRRHGLETADIPF